MYKRRSWQSLVDRGIPASISKTLSISRAYRASSGGGENGGNGGPGGTAAAYRTGTYYGFAADLGQLRLRYNRQALFIDLDRGGEVNSNSNNNNNHPATSNLNNDSHHQDGDPSPPSAADDSEIILPSLPATPTNYTTITIAWSQITKLKRRSAETVEFCFSSANLPLALFSLVPISSKKKKKKKKSDERASTTSPSPSWSIAVHFAMGVSEDLLAEMRLLGLVRKVRYGWWKMRKCYIPVGQITTTVVAATPAALKVTATKEIFV